MKPTKKHPSQFIVGLVGGAALLLASSAAAATFQWTNTAASASFVDPANWTNTASPFGNGVPVAGDNAFVNIPGTSAVIADGDVVEATNIDAQAGAIEITGGNLTASNVLRASGTNQIRISGGVVVTPNLQASAVGSSIAVSGGDVSVTTDGRIAAANGTWELTGGTLNFNKIVIGNGSATSNALVTVSGNAVVSHNQADFSNLQRQLWLGGNNGGSGTLHLKDNASYTITSTLLNDANGNAICVIGNANSGSVWGRGVLTIQDNASFYYPNRIRMARSALNVGTINLNGGSLSATAIERQNGTATFNADGGTVTALAAMPAFFWNFTNAINLEAGGLKFDNGGFEVGLTNTFSGAGGLTKLGSGLLTLSQPNSYTGPTVVSADTLRLTGAADINSSSALTVENFATLEITNINNVLFTAGAFTLNNGTVSADFSATNLTVGTFGTEGFANTINITALPGVSTVPARVKLVKYTTAAPGLVDGNNVLTALNANLPTLGNPSGYLTNNVADKCIELVITSMVVTPVITQQPQPDSAYPGYFAHFGVALEITNSPTYQWRKDGLALSDGGAFSGADTAVLKISNVSASELGNFDVIVSNVSGSVTSSPAALTLRTPSGYEAAAVAAGPVALFMFEDLNDPFSGTAAAYDYAGDRDGTYGVGAQNGLYGIIGPTPGDGFPGFDNANTAARFFGFTPNSHVALPDLDLNTNTITLTAWINPGFPAAFSGVVFSRGGSTVAGMNFTSSFDSNGRRTLGYTWNNEAGTYNWNSGIGPTSGVWSYVALVITPTNATVYIFDATGVRASSLNRAHVAQNFGVGTFIGDDPVGGGNRQVDATLDGVGIYGKSLTQSELEVLYAAGSGVSTFAPLIWAQPTSQTRYAGQNVSFNVSASGSQPLTYQWQQTDGVTYYNITDGGRFSGANSPTLTISNLTIGDATNLVVTVNNAYGTPVSDMITLTVNPTLPAEDITMSVVQGNPQDWNTAAHWSDGLSATESAAAKPGSTYRILPNAAMRTPATGLSSTFPGNSLTIEGAGVFNATIPGSGMGALLLKGDNNCVVTIPKLVMNGGQIFSFMNSGWTVTLAGEVEVLANTPIFAAEDTSARTIHLSAKLTGNGNIEYRGYTGGGNFQPTWVSSLNVSGAANTYSGTWNVIIGTLVGSAPGALGTNTVTVGAQGAVQTTYDINNPDGALVLEGRFNLTRNHTFKSVTVNGTPLAAGPHTFAELNTAYPANFPATWTGQPGALADTSGAGSITVIGSGTTPIPLESTWDGNSLTLTWPAGWMLLEADYLLGPWTTNHVATSPFVVSPTEPQKFFRLQAQ
jgi:autotransporter-associated beta strand protein